MQYKVPQNVDIEDRVIGPLSLRQFIIILIGAGICLILFFILTGPFRILFWFLAILIGTAVFAFAFAKYGDQKMEIFVMSALKTFTTPRKRIWKKEEELPQVVKKNTETKKAADEVEKRTPQEAKNDLSTLAQLVDSGGYSKIEAKDRLMPNETLPIDDSGAKDVIAASEGPDAELNKLIEETKKIPKKEQLVSDAASVNPDQNFDYPKIDLANDDFLKKVK